MIAVSSVLSTFNQLVAVFKLVNIPLERSPECVLANTVLIISKPKIKLIVTGNELWGLRKPMNSGAVFESIWLKIRTHDER